MPGPQLQGPLLALRLAPLEQLSRIDEDEILSLWTLSTRCKNSLENGCRLENMSWRLWFRSHAGLAAAAAANCDASTAAAGVPASPRAAHELSPSSLTRLVGTLAGSAALRPAPKRANAPQAQSPRPRVGPAESLLTTVERPLPSPARPGPAPTPAMPSSLALPAPAAADHHPPDSPAALRFAPASPFSFSSSSISADSLCSFDLDYAVPAPPKPLGRAPLDSGGLSRPLIQKIDCSQRFPSPPRSSLLTQSLRGPRGRASDDSSGAAARIRPSAAETRVAELSVRVGSPSPLWKSRAADASLLSCGLYAAGW